MMDDKSKIFPKSAVEFYVHLYCKRKGTTESKNYIYNEEATKSWLSLTEAERNHFVDKFEESKTSYKKKIAEYLKSTKPYLKKKPYRIHTEDIQGNVEENHSHRNEIDSIPESELSTRGIPTECVPENETNTEDCHLSILTENVPEPIPPNVKTGRELFELIKDINEENDKTWSSLSLVEQKRFQTVVLDLKKEYIRKYKTYLESLPSEELYKHYITKL